MSDKKLLIGYRIEGDAAKLMFTGNPDTAERSDIENVDDASKGLGVLIQDEGANDELVDALTETLKMIKAGIIKEFVVNMENLSHAMQQAARFAVLLSAIAELAEEEEDDDDDTE
jgi:hypothetical protein